MIRTLLKSVRQYKKPAIITPLFMTLEAFCECLIPFFMSKLISAIDIDGIEAAAAMQEILKYGACLIGFAVLSLFSGVMAGKTAATARYSTATEVSPSTAARREAALSVASVLTMEKNFTFDR